MRWLGWLLISTGIASLAIVFSAVGVLPGITVERGPDAGVAQASASAEQSSPWRRTADGWQRATWLSRPIVFRRPALHPVVVGLALTLLVLTSMVFLSGEGRKGEGGRRRAEGGRGNTLGHRS